MCGLAGFVGQGEDATLHAMTRALAHRGPDGEGYYTDAETMVRLGHRRLAILDIAHGQQPMWNEDGSVCVIFNGEIYNHRVLRRELESRGHRFASDHSDTETLVHGFEEWGTELPLRLNGMFAFAIYDRRKRKLFLARDRFGEKPLFYVELPGLFAFASEVRALRKHPAAAACSLSPVGLRKYFAHGFIPSPHTLFTGIRKLPHGHWLEQDIAAGTTRVCRYWQFSVEAGDPPLGDEEVWAAKLEDLIWRSVQDRLESDVPLGVFLSGGIDSSVVLSAAAHVRPAHELHAFSIGFEEPSFDESGFASRVVQHLGTQHHVQMCTVEGARVLLPRLFQSLDEPLGDSSILPTYMLCGFAAERVKVALCGDGGDELFGGYDPFKVLRKARIYHALMPRPIHSAVTHLAARLPVSDRNMSFDFKVNRGLRGLDLAPKFWNPTWLGLASRRELAELLDEPMDVHEVYSEAVEAWDRSRAESLLDRSMEFYANFYLSEGVLVKTDRASMLNGLESRAPFLDNDVVEFARRLPGSVKLRRGVTKWILRRAAARHLPPEIVDRPKKGFGMPVAAWLRTLAPPAESAARLGLNDAVLRRMWREHVGRRRDHRGTLWGWLALHYSLSDCIAGAVTS
jgi:asparagine synthase (glutamine-hydrolysing)